jgi:hypothetical protein
MYLRRVVSGLPINLGVPDYYSGYDRNWIEKNVKTDSNEFRLVEGKYRALNCRCNPQDNDVKGATVIFLGVISLIGWIFGFLIFIIFPLIGISIYIIVKNSLYSLESLWLKNKEKFIGFKDFENWFNDNTDFDSF